MTAKHIHHDVIIEWAKGATIQYYSTIQGKWFDTYKNNPEWGVAAKYRVKPATKKYRVALFNWNNGNVSAINASSEGCANMYEEHSNFVRWLTDWMEYEV